MDTITTQPLPEIFVGREVINSRIKLYLQNKHPLLSQALTQNGVSREDTKSIWYSRDYIETIMNEMNIMNADGLRMYFGAYGNEEGRPEGQLCILMVLTRANGSGHKDIILENEPQFEIRKNMATARSRSNGSSNHEDELPREYNYGAPCPPICLTDDQGFPE